MEGMQLRYAEGIECPSLQYPKAGGIQAEATTLVWGLLRWTLTRVGDPISKHL